MSTFTNQVNGHMAQPSHDNTATMPSQAYTEQEDNSQKNIIEDGPQEKQPPFSGALVFWEGDADPQNPMNFSRRVKMTNVALISALTFITPLASSMFAPGIPQIQQEFNSHSNVIAQFVVSIYVLGFAVGPLILAPLSELYGRLVIYHVSNIGFLLFTIACAESNSMGMLIAMRFLQGCFGAAPVTLGGGTIADVIPVEKRGSVMGIYALGPLLGPCLGPVAGGYLVAATGWRWVFWVITIVAGLLTILSMALLRETYAPVLLQRKTARLRKDTCDTTLKSKLDTGLSTKEIFLRAMIRPTKMLLFSPVVLLCSLYYAVIYGYLYLMFTTFTWVSHETYGISIANVGLTFLGIGVGSLIGLFLIGAISDRILTTMAKKNATPENPDGVRKPEYRLPPLIYTSPTIPIGLFIYGWTAQYKVHWIVPIIGTGLVGIGNLGVFMCLQTYLVDAFTIYAASAIAASTVIRSIAGAILPLAGGPMYESLGLGWGNSLLAFIALALLPVPVLFMKYGEKLRGMYDTNRL